MQRLTIIESPYSGDVERNTQYLRRALRDCFRYGDAPFASHGLYTSVLDDNNPTERVLGMTTGHLWLAAADLVAVYEDYGITRGMEQGIRLAEQLGIRIEMRKIGPNKSE